MTKVLNIDLKSLANAAHFQHMKYIIELANNVPSFQSHSLSQRLLEELNACFAEEDRCLMLAKGSVLTEQITEADRNRDLHYRTYKGMVKAMRGLSDPTMQTAAKILWRHISDYNINTKAAIDKQTAMLTNLVDDLNTKYAKEVNLLNLNTVVKSIEEDNKKVEDLVKQRAFETSADAPGALRNARLATDSAYSDFLDAAYALHLVVGDPSFGIFINETNAIVTRTKSGAPRSRKKPEEVEATALEVESDTTE